MPVRLKSYLALIPLFLLVFSSLQGCPPPEEPWRSQLYPEDWAPGFQDAEGRFLHDFSYAGYHNGEALPDSPPGNTYNVLDYGADNTGATDTTSAIQAAINTAVTAGSGVVLLPAGLYRCDGLLEVTSSNVVIRGEDPDPDTGTRVYFTQVTGMAGKAHITFRGGLSEGPDLLLAEDVENQSFTVALDDASSLNVGDDINVGWVITDDFIAEHAMTGTWVSFNGQWKPFFRRQVIAIDDTITPHVVSLDVPLRYPAKMRDSASVRVETGHMVECGLEDLAIANAVDWYDAWGEERVHAIHFFYAKDCWIRNVHSFETPYAPGSGYHLQSGGMRILSSKRFTVADCRMEKAQNRGGGGCGYLFEITKSNEVLIRDCVGKAGRHNFIQNWDFGTTGCVFLRCESDEGQCISDADLRIPYACDSEYHHSLSMACLVDQSTIRDGWYGGNRQDWSSGAGHSVTQSAYWNTSGGGRIRSFQYGWGYIIGTQDMTLTTALIGDSAVGTEPQDFIEGKNVGDYLVPQSLYEDQRALRLGP